MVRIVLHRADGVAEITWAEDSAAGAQEIHRCWEAIVPNGTVSYYENYERMDGRRFLHFKETCKTTVGMPEEVTGETPTS